MKQLNSDRRRIFTKEGVFLNQGIKEFNTNVKENAKTFQEEFVSWKINYVKSVNAREKVSYAGSTSLPSIEFDIVRKR